MLESSLKAPPTKLQSQDPSATPNPEAAGKLRAQGAPQVAAPQVGAPQVGALVAPCPWRLRRLSLPFLLGHLDSHDIP